MICKSCSSFYDFCFANAVFFFKNPSDLPWYILKLWQDVVPSRPVLWKASCVPVRNPGCYVHLPLISILIVVVRDLLLLEVL